MAGPIAKAPTGIRGFDEISGGGLPAGRAALVCGNAGCGKTLFAAEFIARGVLEFGEPGVFLSFEERADDLSANVASLGFDLPELVREKKLALEEIRVDRSEIEEAGEYDLEGLLLRIGAAIDAVGARRVAIDTLESLFQAFRNHAVLRSELNRLLAFLKERGVTTVITGEQGSGTLTRHGFEEYVSDCVVFLDHRIEDQISTRRLRVVKYRGSEHGTNEYPFLIGSSGLSVLPITSVGLDYPVSDERIESGIPGLDRMLDGAGFYRGSSILISGTAGTGKTSFAGAIVAAACDRGERSMLFSFEESPRQLLRNLASIGIELRPHLEAGLLQIHAARPTLHGIERHLVEMNDSITAFAPRLVAVDPVSNLQRAGSIAHANALLVRLLDALKGRGTTAVMTHLAPGGGPDTRTDESISSLMDAWVLLRDELPAEGDRRRTCYVLKARGMQHSHHAVPYELSSRGILVSAS